MPKATQKLKKYLAPNSDGVETQFSVTFGHIAGSGSDTYGDSIDMK